MAELHDFRTEHDFYLFICVVLLSLGAALILLVLYVYILLDCGLYYTEHHFLATLDGAHILVERESNF